MYNFFYETKIKQYQITETACFAKQIVTRELNLAKIMLQETSTKIHVS